MSSSPRMECMSPPLFLAALVLQLAGIQSPAIEIRDPLPIPQRRVWVVDATGAGDFLEIQPAVDAAGTGDLVLVRAGDYGSFTIDGKSLSIVGPGALPSERSVVVKNIAAGELVVLRALGGTGFSAQDVTGVLWLEDVFLATPLQSPGSPAASLVDVGACVVTDSQAGTAGGLFGGASGISIRRSSLHLFESLAQAEAGSVCHPPGNKNGGTGLVALDASFVLLFDSELRGGNTQCITGSKGISLSVQSSSAWQLDSSFPNGISGSVTTLPGLPRSLSAPPLVSAGAPIQVTITGPPGDSVFTLLAAEPEVTFAPSLSGTLLTGLKPKVSAHGAIPASGVLTVELSVPSLRAQDEFQTWILQSLHWDGQSSYLSSGSLVHVVEPAFL